MHVCTHTRNLSKPPKKVLGMPTADEFMINIDGTWIQVTNSTVDLGPGGEKVRQE